MKIRFDALKRIVKEELNYQILLENELASQNLALYLKEEGNVKIGVLYDVDALDENWTSIINFPGQEKEVLRDSDVYKGFVEVGLSGCQDIGEIQKIVAPGYGRMMWPVGFALSPTPYVMIDRRSVSGKANPAWEREFSQREKQKIAASCKHYPEAYLNYALLKKPEDERIFDELSSNHESFASQYSAKKTAAVFEALFEHRRVLWGK